MCCKYWKYLLGSVEECVQWAGSSKAGFIANINWIILSSTVGVVASIREECRIYPQNYR